MLVPWLGLFASSGSGRQSDLPVDLYFFYLFLGQVIMIQPCGCGRRLYGSGGQPGARMKGG
jgi:hypothetical protein